MCRQGGAERQGRSGDGPSRGRTPVDEHVPVLVEDALAGLAPVADGLYVDATFGRGGHTARLLQALGREGRVLALDRDPQAVDLRFWELHEANQDLAGFELFVQRPMLVFSMC